MLLVEGNELNREIACFILEQKGLRVDCATNGREGLDIFASTPEWAYGIVSMDVMMPVMGGLAAAQAIRALGQADAGDAPIAAMTASALRDDVRRCLDACMSGHLFKPIDPARIHETPQRLLG